jgi:subtilisin family serine protease
MISASRIKPAFRGLVMAFMPLLLAAAPVVALALAPALASARGESENRSPVLYMVQVEGLPSAWSATKALESGASARVAGNRARSQADRNQALQERVSDSIERRDLAEDEVFSVSAAYNGLAVLALPGEAARIESIEGVRSVTRLPLVRPANSHSVPYIGGDDLWSFPSGGLTGQGISIGVIDTGIDYVHTNFGGTGAAGDLAAARSAANNPQDPDLDPAGFAASVSSRQIYPTAKVVGGFDFAGDAYNAEEESTATPRPDPNPMDCPSSEGGGHGTHVAGSAAGLGVEPDGETFTGSYAGLDPTGMRIGPGVAPEAELYSLRVFGCSGSSGLTVQALDWAVDPNRDGNPADRLDVLNLSLGSDFGLPDSPDAKAADAASQAGTIVVIAAGNGGNQIYQSGSPASSARSITVANMVSSRVLDGFRVSSASVPSNDGVKTGSAAANFPWGDLADPVTGQLHYPATNRTGCRAFTPAEAAAVNGRVLLLDWRSTRDDPLSAFACGSRQRVDHAQAAGAVGVILADSAPRSTTAIGGNEDIPAIYVVSPLHNQLRAEAQAGGTEVSFERDLIGSVRSSDEADTIADSSSRGPGAAGVLKPDVSAPGTDITSARAGSPDSAETLSGTSMAAPHVAGLMALLRQRHPSWTVEQLKALVMNSATDNLTSGLATTPPGVPQPPQRGGTGRVDGPAAMDAGAIAYAGDGSGSVGISFGPVEVPPGEQFEREATITVENLENVAKEDLTVAFVPRSAVEGAAWTLPDGATVDLPASGTAEVTVRLTVADPSALRNSRDATLLSGSNRDWIAETSGLVRLTDAVGRETKVPVYASLAPVSTLEAADNEVLLPAGAESGEFEIVGQGVDTGDGENDFISLLTPLELQFASPRKTLAPSDSPSLAAADIREVGVSYEPGTQLLTFGISTWGNRPNPSAFAFQDVYIDTDEDGTDDYWLYADRNPGVEEGDNFGTVVEQLPDGPKAWVRSLPVSSFIQSGRSYDTDVATVAVPRDAVGLDQGNSRFEYRVEATDASGSEPFDETPTLSFDHLNPGISFPGPAIRPDVAGAVGFEYDDAAMRANGSLGALLFHHMNTSGLRSEAITLSAERPVELSVSGPASVGEGSGVRFSATAFGPGGPFDFTWDLGTGSGFLTSGSVASFTAPDGPATRVIKVRADGGSAAVFENRDLAVTNVAPRVRLRNLGANTRRPRLVIATTDPSGADRRAGFRYRVDFGADGRVERRPSGRRIVIPWPRGRKARTVRVTATDKDGGVSRPARVKRPRSASPRRGL